MKKYTVYFEIFGKKMRFEVSASSEYYAKKNALDKAKALVEEQIIFHKVKYVDLLDDFPEALKDIFKTKPQ